jgi:hypothetical protein
MKTKLSIRQLSTIMVLGIMVLASTMVVSADRQDNNPKILPVDEKAYGFSYGEWSAKWWQWAVALPAAENPITDTTGQFCNKNQDGKVWFLAGTAGGSVARKCTIPAGKAILFPIITAEWSVGEAVANGGNCFVPAAISGTSKAALQACAKAAIDLVNGPGGLKKADVDGISVQNLDKYRVQSPLFEFNADRTNVFGIPPGPSHAVSDGY